MKRDGVTRAFFKALPCVGLLVFLLGAALFHASAVLAHQPIPYVEGTEFLSSEDRAFLARKQVIRKCVDPHWMPLEGIDSSGEHVGVIADILEIIEQRIETPIKLVPTNSWLESLAKLKSRECDIVTSDTEAGELPHYYRKTIAFLDMRNVYITRKDAPLQLEFSAIKDKPIGIPRGYPTIAPIQQHYGHVNVVEVENVKDGLLKVSKGELYAFTGLLPVCSYAIQELGLTNLKVAGHLEISFPTVMDVRSDMPRLLEIMNKALLTIDESTLNQLFMDWVDIQYDMKTDWRELLKYAFLVCIVLVVILFWNHKLRTLNRKLDAANEELALLSEMDSMTRLKNRLFLTRKMPELIALASRNRLSLGVALFDIDHFKRINDNHGHAVGDQCLIAFANMLTKVFQRETDWIIRYGGEEFLLICTGLTQKDFTRRLEDCRTEVEAMVVPAKQGQKVSFSVSVGGTFFPVTPDHWEEALLDQVDKNLYRAKQAGRNKVVSSSQPAV